ncbi:MAG: DUF3301 domain-containing protein [bacterium]
MLLLFIVIVLAIMLLRNRQIHEQADRIARQYCNQNGLQFLDGTVVFKGMRLERKRLHFCRSYRFDYSLNSADRYHGLLTLCGEHIQSFRVNPDHLRATPIQ